MALAILCVDKWRSQWHYRHNKVVLGDDVVFDNLLEASFSLNMSTHTLHKSIVRMWTVGNDDISYSVYKDESASTVNEYKHGDKKITIHGNITRKRRRKYDDQNCMSAAKVQCDRH